MKVRYTFDGNDCLVDVESVMLVPNKYSCYKLLVGFYGGGGNELYLGRVVPSMKDRIMEALEKGKVVNLDEYLMKS